MVDMKRISNSSGAGKKILNNWTLFRYEFDKEKSEDDFYVFKVVFGNQVGYINYRVREDGVITDVNLDITGFAKSLGSNNDASLRDVATRLHSFL
jgi:hypothetical protein